MYPFMQHTKFNRQSQKTTMMDEENNHSGSSQRNYVKSMYLLGLSTTWKPSLEEISMEQI